MVQTSFAKKSSIRSLFQNINWEETPLGPMSKWPESLKTTIGIILDSQFPMFISWGPERTFLYNDAYAVILGEKHPAALGRKFEVIWSEIWDDLLPLIHSVDAGQPVYLEDMRLVMNRYGYEEETFFTFSYSPIRDQSNRVQGLFCAVVETTERRQSEDALKVSEENLKGTLDSMSDAFYSVDKDWKVTAINKNLLSLTGRQPEELIGQNALDLWFSNPEQRKGQFWTQFHKAMNERVPVSFVDYYAPFDLWTQARAYPKADGGIAIFVSDIGEIKKAEEALAAERKKAEEKLKNDQLQLLRILENIPGAVAMVSGPEFTFTYANSNYRKLFLGSKEHLGRKVSEVLPGTVEQGFINILEEVYQTARPFKGTEVVYEAPQSDGTLKTMYLNLVYEPVRNSTGQTESILAAAFDVTEHVQAKKEAQNANLSKTAFLANMSHEIRTPMTAVLGFAEVLRESDLTDFQREDALRRIEGSGRSLLKLIDDILDISKVESGKLSIEKVRFSPLEVVGEVVSLLKLQAEQKGILIKTFISSDVPAAAYSDPARIRQILTNLIGNAVKFTAKGEVRVELDVEAPETSNENFLIIKVSDTGIGISEQEHAKLFHPFAQADETISRQFGGTGLGLALSKRLAEQLGGSLELSSSQLGQGSQFTVKIEAGSFESTKEHNSSEKSEVLSDQEAPIANQSLEERQILVVDDVQDNQILMRRYLEAAGARVDLANDGAEAVKRAMAQEYDLIIMDIQMPVVDGIQATKQLRSQGYQQPILALTAHAMKSEIQRSMDAGCSAHLTKPISKQGLINAVSQFI